MKTPDIEIYLKQVSADVILKWLALNFTQIDIPNFTKERFSKGIVIKGRLMTEEVGIPIIITPHAAGKAFCSIWFKSENTPWQNDEACAMDFLSNTKTETEIRCSAGGWSETEADDSELWLSITYNEKKLIRWG